MGISDLLDDIQNGPRFRPLIDKVEQPPPPQVPQDGSDRTRVPMPPSPGPSANGMNTGTKSRRPKSNATSGAGSGSRGTLKSDKQAVASSRNNGGSPTQPKTGSGPTRTPRNTSARADPLAKPNQNLGPSDRRTSDTSSQPPARKQQTKKTPGNTFPIKKRAASKNTASKSTTPASSRGPAPSTKAQSKQPPKAVNEPAKSSNDPDKDDIESLFDDSVLPSIEEEEPPKPAPVRRQKGSALGKIISQTKREATYRKRTQAKLREDAAERAVEEAREAEIAVERQAKAAKEFEAAHESKELAARSLISPSLTPTVIPAGSEEDLDLGEVKINNNRPLSALLATSGVGMDPLKQGNYPIILSDALLGKASKETVSGIRYNHKPALSSDTAPSQARLKRSAKDGTYNLGFDDNGDKYQYSGVRTAADSQYVLVFDQERKAFVLHQVDSMFNMNITKTPIDTNAAKQFPPLEVKGAVLDKPAPKQKVSTAPSKNKEAPTKNAPAGKGRGGKAAQNKQNTATMPHSKPASLPHAEQTKRGKPSTADSEDEDDDDDDGGLTIEYPDGPPPERFKPTVNKYASPALALSRRFSEFAAAYNPDEEEDVDMDVEFESRFNEDADGEGGGYEDDDEEEDEDMVDALALPSPINKPTTMARTNSYHENPLPPPDRFSFDDGSDMEAEFENVEEAAPSNNQVNAADGIDDAEIAAMEEELAKEMESDVSEEE